MIRRRCPLCNSELHFGTPDEIDEALNRLPIECYFHGEVGFYDAETKTYYYEKINLNS